MSLPHHDIILGQPWLEKWNPDINWKTHTINFTRPNLEQPDYTSPDPEPTTIDQNPNQVQLSLISHQQLNKILGPDDQLFLCEISEAGLVYSNAEDPRVQGLLAEFQDVFPDKLPAELPPKRDVNHRITLEPGSTPPW